MNDRKLELEGNALIESDAARAHEMKKWEHEERLAKIHKKGVDLQTVAFCCFLSWAVGGIMGIIAKAAQMAL
jgi:hypothetical protein